jgi:FAD-dependent urate hydroxylase
MADELEVAIVGAGPYGLSVAAHMRAAKVPFRIFGSPMSLWRSMPSGMILKSQGFASNLSSPQEGRTLQDYCAAKSLPYMRSGLPIPRDTFLGYGEWFWREHVPEVEDTLVTQLARKNGGFEIALADGEHAWSRNVVFAVGVAAFARVPEQLAALPAAACTHSSAHHDLGAFRGKSVIVIGAGQSALESAALLNEQGANVQLVARGPSLIWNAPALPASRPLIERVRKPQGGLGPGWRSWVISEHPELWWPLPEATRMKHVRTALGPAGASWLFDRVNERFPVTLGQTLVAAEGENTGVRLTFAGPSGTRNELTADHVIAATGYWPDVRKLGFLDSALRSGLRTVANAPVVDRNFQSSVPGLYFVGAAVAPSYGPLMRFVYGARFAATTLTRHLARPARRQAGVRAFAAEEAAGPA